MRIAIVGYGKMGRLIESLASEYGIEVAVCIDETPAALPAVDAAIEFSTPETAVTNIRRFAELKVNAVVGTTGWFDRLPEVREAIAAAGTGLVYGANFSLGVALFSKLVEECGRLFAEETDYEAWAWEIHHSMKRDAPSGTLLKLVADMRRGGYARQIDTSSNRAGKVPGTHEIGFDSAADTITLRHTARNREGFARGALRAAKWIAGRKGVYEFKETV
jgi:4-hydroxy-tetrahydrodipicolinate reductase